MRSEDWIKKLDYTLLEDCNEYDIQNLCLKAINLGVKSVCVYPKWVKLCSELLKESEILVCTVIDFPFGNQDIQSKIQESKDAIESGADELDVVIDNSKLNNPDLLLGELIRWVDFCHQYHNKNGEQLILKTIVESGQLSLNETETATQVCIGSRVDFIKTSTGKLGVGAELEKVVVMRSVIEKEKSNLQIKASGGIKTQVQIEQFYPYVNRFGMGYKSVDSLVENA